MPKDPSGYYEAKDFLIGNTIKVYNRDFVLMDCDKFTKNYFKDQFNID